MGPGLPGQRSVLSATDRAFVEARWGVPAGTLHTRLGQGTIDLFQRMATGAVSYTHLTATGGERGGREQDRGKGSCKTLGGHGEVLWKEEDRPCRDQPARPQRV